MRHEDELNGGLILMSCVNEKFLAGYLK